MPCENYAPIHIKYTVTPTTLKFQGLITHCSQHWKTGQLTHKINKNFKLHDDDDDGRMGQGNRTDSTSVT